MTLQVAKNNGGGKIFILDTLDYRLTLAQKLGATTTINIKKEDHVQRILKDGGVDTVFEAVGHQETVVEGLSMVKKGGKVIIIGNVGTDPEMRFTPNGNPVTSFRIATSRTYTTPEGERKQETEWFDVVTWNRLAENCNQLPD
jgi:threonine dehydrogenase-like Zn-dependent dehydrogenase